MFSYNQNLLFLPDISKWKTNNVTNMSNMFSYCENIESLPDISKWNTKNVTNISYMFSNCKKIKSLPDISKWNTNNVKEIKGIFSNCSSLTNLPDISKWNTIYIYSMDEMFKNCSSLITLPNIYKWKTPNLTSMRSMFYGCFSLESLPNISKMNISNSTDMSYIFYGCSPELYIENISKWDKKSVLRIINDFNEIPHLFSGEINKSKFVKKLNFLRDFKNNPHFVCKNCHKIPLITLKSFTCFIINCKCNCSKETTIQEISENYLLDKEENEQNSIVVSSFFCEKHIKNYKYYCRDCKNHICKKCMRISSEHYDHELELFDSYLLDLELKIGSIKSKLEISEDEFRIGKKIDDKKKIKLIINIIINDYNKYKNYYSKESIENIYSFLYPNSQVIKSIDEIKNITNLDKIYSIIICSQNLEKIDIICRNNLVNLENLILSDNNITDISPLVNANFINLKILDLECNKVNDKNIQYFKSMNFQNLNHLNLFSNELTDFEFFNNLKSFPNLKILYLGANPFDKSFNINKMNFYEINNNFNSLREIGLSNGVFSDKSINIISKINLKNLKILLLNKNNLSSLSFVKDLDCLFLEEIWLNENQIEDVMPLIKFKYLKNIQIANNKIKNFDNVLNLFKSLEYISVFNLKGNEVEINEKNNIYLLDSLINDKKQ